MENAHTSTPSGVKLAKREQQRRTLPKFSVFPDFLRNQDIFISIALIRTKPVRCNISNYSGTSNLALIRARKNLSSVAGMIKNKAGKLGFSSKGKMQSLVGIRRSIYERKK